MLRGRDHYPDPGSVNRGFQPAAGNQGRQRFEGIQERRSRPRREKRFSSQAVDLRHGQIRGTVHKRQAVVPFIEDYPHDARRGRGSGQPGGERTVAIRPIRVRGHGRHGFPKGQQAERRQHQHNPPCHRRNPALIPPDGPYRRRARQRHQEQPGSGRRKRNHPRPQMRQQRHHSVALAAERNHRHPERGQPRPAESPFTQAPSAQPNSSVQHHC